MTWFVMKGHVSCPRYMDMIDYEITDEFRGMNRKQADRLLRDYPPDPEHGIRLYTWSPEDPDGPYVRVGV